jgi:hypothetical protein
MDISEGRYLKIKFVNSEEKIFAFEPLTNTTDPTTIATRVQQMLDSGRLLLKAADKLMIIPLTNVISIEVSPCPPAALPHAINVLHEFE